MFIGPAKKVRRKLSEWWQERRDREKQRQDVCQYTPGSDPEAFPIVQKDPPTGMADYGARGTAL